METMTPVSVIQLMPESKDQVATFVDNVVDQITSGAVDPFVAAAYLKTMEDVVKGIRDNKEVKEAIRFELNERGGKVTIGNASISEVETSRYNYSVDGKWNEFKAMYDKAKEQMTRREKLLKAIEEEVADPDTGELIVPAEKTISKTIRVTLK